MLRFGVPLVPAGLAMWVLNSSDKYFLNYYAGAADVGIYNVGYKFGSLVTLVSKAISLATPRFVFSIYKERPNAKAYYKKLITYFFLLMFTGAFLISVFAREATQVFVGPSFQEAYMVIPLIAFSYVADSLFDNFGIGISVTGKTYLSALAVFISGVLNIIFNFLLISNYGMMGAAVATLLSFATLALVELYFSQRVYYIPVEAKRMFIVLILGGVLVVLSTLIDFGFLASILVKSLIVLAFPISLFVFGFFDEGEINGLKKIWVIVRSTRGSPKALLESVRQTFLINDSVNSK
jgi:O-antigen/teichoic acid export membrane protein